MNGTARIQHVSAQISFLDQFEQPGALKTEIRIVCFVLIHIKGY